MSSNSIIVSEYLKSLNEDKELDYIFPQLLQLMGFQIVQTAIESKGQSQYGKDIVAIGKASNGFLYRWYFEIKGHNDRDITNSTYFKDDGVRESIIEAKDTAFSDSSLAQFNDLPVKIVFVHNGVLKANIRPTFEGFIKREFKIGEFERWDIYKLTKLFSDYFFDENLFFDVKTNMLLKKTLAYLDSPDNKLQEFKELIDYVILTTGNSKGKYLRKFFSTLNIINSMVFVYSLQNNNLNPAKECSKYIVIKAWHWILSNNLYNKRKIKALYNGLLEQHLKIFETYFKKTFPVARLEDGLFSELGADFEKISYPLRCFEYLEDSIHYCNLRNEIRPKKNLKRLKNKQKDLLIELVNNNSGFHRPVFDHHSIGVVQLFLFFAEEDFIRQKDINFIYEYLIHLCSYLRAKKIREHILPELTGNLDAVIETVASGKKTTTYIDSTSILLATLLEISTVFRTSNIYELILDFISDDLSLQIPLFDLKIPGNEELLFEKNLYREYHIETLDLKFIEKGINLPSFSNFRENVLSRKTIFPDLKTDNEGYSSIRYLAHSYYKNEILPFEWRKYIKK